VVNFLPQSPTHMCNDKGSVAGVWRVLYTCGCSRQGHGHRLGCAGVVIVHIDVYELQDALGQTVAVVCWQQGMVHDADRHLWAGHLVTSATALSEGWGLACCPRGGDWLIRITGWFSAGL
jgi:hypothetical protein